MRIQMNNLLTLQIGEWALAPQITELEKWVFQPWLHPLNLTPAK